jgi:hypothetical protein
MLDKAAKNELPEDVPDDLSNLIIDRDTCMASVVGSHDIHIGKLLAREDETRAAETRGMATVIDGYVCCAILQLHMCIACSLVRCSCCMCCCCLRSAVAILQSKARQPVYCCGTALF